MGVLNRGLERTLHLALPNMKHLRELIILALFVQNASLTPTMKFKELNVEKARWDINEISTTPMHTEDNQSGNMQCAIKCASTDDCGAFYYKTSICHLAKSGALRKPWLGSTASRSVYTEEAKWLTTTTCCYKIVIDHNRTDYGWNNGQPRVGGSREKELVLSKYTQNGREYYYHCPGDEFDTCTGGALALWRQSGGASWCLGSYDNLGKDFCHSFDPWNDVNADVNCLLNPDETMTWSPSGNTNPNENGEGWKVVCK